MDGRLYNRMKRVFSILFSLMILLSGVHLTVASHICCGELAAVKWSVTGAKASCGMEDQSAPCPGDGSIDTNCCKNHLSQCSTDGNYFPTVQKSEVASTTQVQLLATFITLPSPAPVLNKTYHSMVGPPVQSNWNSVDQSTICVFII